MINLVYVDNCVLISKNSSVMDEFIKSLRDRTDNFDFMDVL